MPAAALREKLLKAQYPADKVNRLIELRTAEPGLVEASAAADADARTALAAAVAELAGPTRETVWLPAVREVVADWLAVVRKGKELDTLLGRLRAARLDAGLSNPFAGRVPGSDQHEANLPPFAADLIQAGYAAREDFAGLI